jgi:hypothetical protein
MIHLVPPEDRTAPQRVSKMQYPLVLLDQQLQSLVREDERCHHSKTTATWPTLKEQAFRCGAGNAKAPSGPREQST